ncbi:MAG: HAMP domain-containing histidine kinase [Oscillospiraceae bacterium]|jgi:signal transduction histidine kinase|nr:HAMP domain-containing histidine kinase [Oscillospiraceae bacterium]
MKKFFHSLRVKVYTLFLFFTAVILFFLFASQMWLVPAMFNSIKTREVVETAEMIKSAWNNRNFPNIVRNAVIEQGTYILIRRDGLDIIYYNEALAGLDDILSSYIFDEIADEIVTRGSISHHFTDSGKNALLYLTYAGTPNNVKGYILIFSYLEPIGNTISIAQSQFLINAGLLLFVSAFFSAFIVSQISKPVIGIFRSADKLPTGEFNIAINRSDSTEIRLLKENLNKASAEIAKTETLRKDLLANISHDLKTPLTMIKAYAEMIRDLSGNNPEKREKHLEVIIGESDRLNALVTDILDLSKLQSGVAALSLREFDFSARLSGIISRFSYLRGNYSVRPEIESGIFITADVTKLEQAVYNLVGNALNFTGEDGAVTVRMFAASGNVARFEVCDSGNGIAPEQLPFIWERYYKADNSVNHSRAVIGTGLGLSIVKNVLELHGFRYGVESKVGEGSRFWFEMAYKKIYDNK